MKSFLVIVSNFARGNSKPMLVPSSLQTVFASLMDTDAVGQLEKEKLLQVEEMSTSTMQNLWVKEVRYTNTLTDVRDVIQELLGR